MKKWQPWARVFILSVLLCLANNGAAYSSGKMKDLGTLGGYRSSARGINNSGQIVGESDIDPMASWQPHAFLYSGGTMADLGTLPGGSISHAKGINNSGQIVGSSTVAAGQTHAFSYSGGMMTDLGAIVLAIGQGTYTSDARGINNLGQIVGYASYFYGYQAFLYSGGKMTNLGVLPGMSESCATAINDSGQIVGYSDWTYFPFTECLAFLYSVDTMTDLGVLTGMRASKANAINSSGQIVGESYNLPPYVGHSAFLYSGGTKTDLGSLGGGYSCAYGINNNGQIVGESSTPSGQRHAFLYSGGRMTDLGTLGGDRSCAYGINDLGQIVGESTIASGQTHAFLYSPFEVFLNEIHYNNIGTDVGEAIEVAGTAGTNLANWSIVLYNGANSLVYDTIALSGVIPNQQKNFGTLVFYPHGIIQNGAPDGIALVAPSNNVIQFLSYQGAFVANDGPAKGIQSTDIGVFEDGTTPVGYSLQNTGLDADSKWSGPSPNTFGSLNAGQRTRPRGSAAVNLLLLD
jgi:probable HAF family extracellular repeat protein